MPKFIRTCLLSSIAGVSLSLTGCSNASSADQINAAAVDVSAVPDRGNWDIQPDASHIRFTAKQEGAPFTGHFKSFSGVIDFDPDAPEAGAVKITIPLGGVEAGSNDRNSTLPEKVWFSTKAFPSAIFTSTDISALDEAFIARGELNLKGKTVPLNLTFKLVVEGDVAVMTSRHEIDRTDWNVGAAPWDTDEWVSRAVELDIQVTAHRIKS